MKKLELAQFAKAIINLAWTEHIVDGAKVRTLALKHNLLRRQGLAPNMTDYPETDEFIKAQIQCKQCTAPASTYCSECDDDLCTDCDVGGPDGSCCESCESDLAKK